MHALNFPFVDTYSSIIIESLAIKKMHPALLYNECSDDGQYLNLWPT